MKDKNTRSRRRLVWVAVALIPLLAALLLLPRLEKCVYTGQVVAYSRTDPSIAVVHEIVIDGVYKDSLFFEDSFRGEFFLSGLENLEERTKLVAIFRRESVYSYDFYFVDDYGEPHDNRTAISGFMCDGDWEKLIIRLNGPDEEYLIALGADSREETLSRYDDFRGTR